MKFSLFRNDKSTAKDELLLLVFIAACICAGAALVAVNGHTIMTSFGVLMILTGIAFIPGLIYRLLTNDKKKRP